MSTSKSADSLSLSTSPKPNDCDVNDVTQICSHQISKEDLILKILEILDLDDSAESKRIVEDLLIQGRHALVKYKDDVAPNVFQKQMDDDSSELLELLKTYWEQRWQSNDENWFREFLAKQKATSADLYYQILTRTAQSGSKFMKDNISLSLVLQFLFEFNDDEMEKDAFFDKIWQTLTTEGRQGIKQYSDDIAPTVLTKQLENDESPLYLALRNYYHQPLTDLLKQKDINITKPDVIKIILDRVADCGWRNGSKDEIVQKSIAPKKLRILEEKLNSFVNRSTLPEVLDRDYNTNVPFVSTEDLRNDPTDKSLGSSGSIDLSLSIAETNYYAVRQQAQQRTQENNMMLTCIKQNGKLHPSNLVEAGELMYINQKFNDVLDKIIENFRSKRNFASFIRECLTPIMYLLKRHQNLDDFIERLSNNYRQHQSSLPNLSLRMIIHLLLLNSDLSLSRMIISLLSKRNPVPFLEPSVANESSQLYSFVSDIIHVWDYSRPVILSFGIGKCLGKSTLLNRLFMSTFEQSTSSIYFQHTIDIDFGYSFSPRRSINFADTHGVMTKQLLTKIHPLFDGFLIQIEHTHMSNSLQTVSSMLDVISQKKCTFIIVRDVPMTELDKCSTYLEKRFLTNASVEMYSLPNIIDQTNRDNNCRISQLQEKIFKEMPTTCPKDQTYLRSQLQKLMDTKHRQYINEMYKVVIPSKQKLIQAAEDNSGIIKYFPEYSKFVKLCRLQSNLIHFNFFGNQNDAAVYDARCKIYELQNTNRSDRANLGVIFYSFLEVLTASNMLMCLELLTSELKEERTRLTSTSETLSLEVLWRNTIVCSPYQSYETKEILYQKYYEYISAGFPFEIIDGDNFYFQQQFLSQTLKRFPGKKTLVISVIGPQNSGKSTLLNYMFGTVFDVRDGRCTRGIYGSFVKSNRSEFDFDYILLLDTEGLFDLEKNDMEYDRRIVLFCLAVSHIVIVNLKSEIIATFQTMLTLCADSLKNMDVTRIPKPVIHFILNQKADLNIENSRAGIDRILSDFRNLNEFIDIRNETFHTLPFAFKHEGQSLRSHIEFPALIKTEPDFLEHVQLISDKIICSAKLSSLSDPLQWFKVSKTIFDTLQKFSDLTYYHDINERRVDNEIREHIKNKFQEIFTCNYRDRLIMESLSKNEDEIKEFFLTEQTKVRELADRDIEDQLKSSKASEPIRIRNGQFLHMQIIEMFNALRATCIAANEREKLKLLVRNGTGDLQRLIDDIINRGTQMSTETAGREFDRMFNNNINHITSKFIHDERLKQAFNYIYTNYNIYEKEYLPAHQHISPYLSLLMTVDKKQRSMLDLKDKLILEFTNLTYQHCSVTAHHYNPMTRNFDSLDMIGDLVYLNKQLLKQEFIKHMNQYTSQFDDRKRREGHQNFAHKFVNAVTAVFSHDTNDSQNQQASQGPITITTTTIDQFQMNIRKMMQEQKPRILTSSRIDEDNMFLRISQIKEIIVQTIITTIQNDEIRQIETELIQKIVGLITSIITDINDEMTPLCLTLSRQLKSTLHMFTVILLSKYYYDEQWNHFTQILANMQENKDHLRNYFISMVAPDASLDSNYALYFSTQLQKHLLEEFESDGQHTIDAELNQHDQINRKSMQDRCDGHLMINDDTQWNLDYIENPTKILEQKFKEIWTDIEKSINQKLIDRKSHYRNTLIEFFHCIQGILDSVKNLGPAARFVDDMFQPEENNSLDADKNLKNKKRCMTILLYAYFSGQVIPRSCTVNTKIYTLEENALDTFRLLAEERKPADILIKIMENMSSTFHNNSIGNLVGFLQCLLDEKERIVHEFDRVKSSFTEMDTKRTYERLLDKVRGCPHLCPCCKRPCDVDHTQIKSQPGSQNNEHRCMTGHALRAMNGYKFEITEEASLLMCEQIEDDQIVVVDTRRYRWSGFKLNHSTWKFESHLDRDDLDRLHGKFLMIWQKIGKILCQKYNMKYVTHNIASRNISESFHYILLLDGSTSMRGKRWEDLIVAVQEFLTHRRELNTDNHITIIVFASAARIVYFDDEIDKVDPSTIQASGGGTDFGAAFRSVNDCIDRSKTNTSTHKKNDHAIVFMSDGEAIYPEHELNQLLQAHNAIIKRFWTLSLGDTKSTTANILKKINEKMNGAFYDVPVSTDLIKAYAEVANSGTSRLWNGML